MQGNERWEELCKQASSEKDPKKLVDLISEINSLLEAKRQRLNGGSMENPKPNNDKHIELSEEDLKKVAGGKMAVKQPSRPPLTGGDSPADDPHSTGPSTE